MYKGKTYCFSRNHITQNTQRDKEIMKNKVITEKSKTFKTTQKS